MEKVVWYSEERSKIHLGAYKGESNRVIENPIIIDSLWNWKNSASYENYYADAEEEKIVPCAVCGKHELEDEMFDSQLWEDIYLCGSRGCNEEHYNGWSESMKLQKLYAKKEKRSSANEHFSGTFINLNCSDTLSQCVSSGKQSGGRE